MKLLRKIFTFILCLACCATVSSQGLVTRDKKDKKETTAKQSGHSKSDSHDSHDSHSSRDSHDSHDSKSKPQEKPSHRQSQERPAQNNTAAAKPAQQPKNLSKITFKVGDVSFNMVRVERGTFTMGATSEANEPMFNERPAHRVSFSEDYYIGETEVTQALWVAVMGTNPSAFKDPMLPVEGVSWDDCQEFINRLGSMLGKQFRLPTEAEWEFAARGGNKGASNLYSGSNTIDDVAWYNVSSGNKPNAVGSKQANELGLRDMSGNVAEWCQDYFGAYSADLQISPTGPASGKFRVYRGGSWDANAWSCRLTARGNRASSFRDHNLGLRLAMAPQGGGTTASATKAQQTATQVQQEEAERRAALAAQEAERRAAAEEASRRAAEENARRLAAEEAARKAAAEEAAKKRAAEEAARKAAAEEAARKEAETKIFTSVDQMPTFPGGDAALMKYLKSHVRYPQQAFDNGIQGKVIVQFVVTKTGQIGEVKVARSVDKDLDREAMRVVKSLPKFVPGRQNGQAVAVWYTLPVSFTIN